MYQALYPKVNDLWDCLLVFNLPFTVMKGLLCAVITFLIYKPISLVMKTVESKFVVANRKKEYELNKKRVAAVVIPSENVENTDSAENEN